MAEGLSRFWCSNERCPDYGQRGRGNLTVGARYGKDKQRRMLSGRSCTARFSEPKGTPLFGSQPTAEQAPSIFQHLAERNGVRATARLVKLNRNTGVRYCRLVGDHARQLHDELVAFSPQHPFCPVRREVVLRLQEAGALRSGGPRRWPHGDWWGHAALDPESRLVLAVVPGARDAESVAEVVDAVEGRTGGRVALPGDNPGEMTVIPDKKKAEPRIHADRLGFSQLARTAGERLV